MKYNKKIDWEERRYEIAKAMMPQVTVLVMDVLNRGQRVEGASGKTIMQVVTERALWYADALIEAMRNGEKQDARG